MKKRNLIFIAIVVLSLLGIFYLKASGSEPISEEPPTTTVYDFTVIDNQGNEVSLSQYRGKVLLIVNTATRCGHTPQYEELQQLYSVYKDKGFEILDFPCNQFAEQAPESDEEIQNFCTLNYHTEFPRFHKIDVNGENAIPLYQWLTENTKFEGFGKAPMALILSGVVKKSDKDYKNNGNVKWNFTKFLIDRNGEIVARFEPTVMKKLKEAIKGCL